MVSTQFLASRAIIPGKIRGVLVIQNIQTRRGKMILNYTEIGMAIMAKYFIFCKDKRSLFFFFFLSWCKIFARMAWKLLWVILKVQNIIPLESVIGPSSIASPICQEGQSERILPIFASSSQFLFFFSLFFLISSLFFLIFSLIFAVRGGTLPPLAPQCYATDWTPQNLVSAILKGSRKIPAVPMNFQDSTTPAMVWICENE